MNETAECAPVAQDTPAGLDAGTGAPDAPVYVHRASYSPQDDKLRLFFAYRIPRAEWDQLRAQGWTWTMKQSSDMVAPWTPEREDAALALCGEIEDEDEPREGRSADRAERFAGYGEKREGEAEALADRYEDAPRVHAAQDSRRAERAAARHDRIGTRAADKWSTAEYWTARTAGVIAHALYLERADVRHRRIKGIEAEIRALEERWNKARTVRGLWEKVAAIADPETQNGAALRVANIDGSSYDFRHPTNPERRPSCLWTLLREDQPEADRISGAQAAALYLARYGDPDAPGSSGVRWLAHLRLRLEYENQMLAAVGGTLANAPEIIAGGFLGRHRVVKVSKDRAGRVSRVYVLGPKGYGDTPETLVEVGIRAEKFDPADYRAPTPQELAEFLAERKARSAKKPKPLPLVNPDAASARALQDELNRARLESFTRRHGTRSIYTAPAPAEILEMTSEQWARVSGAGAYSRAHVETIREDGTVKSRSNMWSAEEAARDKVPALFRVRMADGGANSADRVVVLTDKPRGPIAGMRAPALVGGAS